MQHRNLLKLFIFLGVALSLPACGPKSIKTTRYITQYDEGLEIVLHHETRMNQSVGAYTPLHVVFTNHGATAFKLNGKADQWIMKDSQGNIFRAILDLKNSEPSLWARLPYNLRQFMNYPEEVGPSQSRTFSLLIPGRAQVQNFQSLRFFSSVTNKNYDAR